MAGELAAEWIKIPDGNGNLQKVWIRDSTARRDVAQLQTDLAQLQTDVGGLVIPDPSDTAPQMDGTAAAGSSADYSRADHVHPVDTSRQAALSQAQLDAANSGITAAKVAAYDAIQVPTKTSELVNDSGFITSAPVASVNGQTGAVSLDASDVGALPDNTAIPTKTSDLTNDSGYITASDIPTIPTASAALPAMDGTASAGSSANWSRGDHVHPHDTSKQDALSAAQLSAVNSGVTAAKVSEWDAIEVPTKTSELTNDSGFITSAPVTSVNGQTGAVTISVPTKTSDLTNDSGFLTSAPVASVNGQTGTVSLTASDVGALPSSTAIPSKTSDLTNDSGFITSAKFAVITCTLSASSSYGAYTALPSGFTYGNCVILSVQVPDGSGERVGQGIFTTTNMRLFAEVSANGVRVYNNTSRYYSVDVKVTLMRTDI